MAQRPPRQTLVFLAYQSIQSRSKFENRVFLAYPFGLSGGLCIQFESKFEEQILGLILAF
jgi:hypothetical protein